MQKFLCTFITSMAIANVANAGEAPKVTLGGKADFMAGYRKQSKEYRYKVPGFTSEGKDKRKGFVTDVILDIKADGTLENGTKYGGLVRLHTDTSKKATNSEDKVLDKGMVYLQDDRIGRLEFGVYPGAGGMLEMDTTNFSRAAYGVEGFWSQWVNQKTLRFAHPGLSVDALGHQFIVSPNLPSNYSGHYYSDAPKITFYTQPIKDLTVGVSYIPDMDDSGSLKDMAPRNSGPQDENRQNNPPTMRDIISGGIQYKFKVQDIAIQTSIVGEVGKAKSNHNTNLIRDLKAYEAGLAATYKDFTVLGSYGSWCKTGSYKEKFEGTKQGSAYWTLGVAQTIGDFAYSITYMNSKKAGGMEGIGSHAAALRLQKPQRIKDLPTSTGGIQISDTGYNKFRNLSVGMDYKLAEGLLAYAEVSMFKFKEANINKVNRGHIVLTGVRLSF